MTKEEAAVWAERWVNLLSPEYIKLIDGLIAEWREQRDERRRILDNHGW